MSDDQTRLPLRLPLAAAAALPGCYLGGADYRGLPHPERRHPWRH